MSLDEIVLPETKPETEWVRGRAVRKVSPTYSHARLQTLIAMALTQWAEEGSRGRVGTEWRFRVTPPGKVARPLVPDVAFLSYERLSRDAATEFVEVPRGAPTVVFEILSRADRPRDVADKIETYLASGAAAVVLIDPSKTICEVHAPEGRRVQSEGEFSHPALPGFRLDVGALFARAKT